MIVAGLAAARAASGPAPLALINVTSSEPPGLYLRSGDPPARGRLIAFPPPAGSGAVSGGRLARFHSFLKEVAAGPGDQVCSDGRRLTLDAGPAVTVHSLDRLGRLLPRWIGCRRLRREELFVLSTRSPNSYDSRYFGPVPERAVIGVYRPIWTWP